MKIFLVLAVVSLSTGMKQETFKKCRQSGFCTRNKAFAESSQPSVFVIENSLSLLPTAVNAKLVTPHDELSMGIEFFESTVRVVIDESKRKRWVVSGALVNDGADLKGVGYKHSPIQNGIKFEFGQGRVELLYNPFVLDFYQSGKLVTSVNRRGYFNFESYRERPSEPTPEPKSETETDPEATETKEAEKDMDSLEERLKFGMYEEKFGDHTDSKKYGPSSIAVDVTFPSTNVYGIPEHATNMSLKSTEQEPYRLYNLDVFEFELDSPVALYGSVPLLWSHQVIDKKFSTSAFFWLNAAETWVDVKKTSETMTHWISEDGRMDFFVLLGPRPKDVFKQYAILTGSQNLPPLFSLGYHQCRWNYNDHADVDLVHDNFEVHDIPLDVVWLDIEHTDEKKYFTWHLSKFNDPIGMLDRLWSLGRRMVTIIDPHIKRDDSYHVKKQASTLDLFVKNKDGGEFEGWCWSGSSSWIDYLNPEARKFWASLFAYDKYTGSSATLFTWNDMNEPSVFTGPETTMPKDALHYQGLEHRQVHNIYGMLMHQSTYEGHLLRSKPQHRPFVLSRAFFAGTQRFGAIWTGDNMAGWDHLQSASQMLLSISLGGVGFCGADIGGFFGDPDWELLARWYIAGAFYPFFRGHAHLETKRREPYLAPPPYLEYIRNAIILRYRLLPYLYTTFRQGMVTGQTPMRPLFTVFPDSKVLEEGDSYMLGDALLVRPSTKPSSEGGDSISLYLPIATWYHFFTGHMYEGGLHTVDSRLENPPPVFLLGGKGVVTRDRLRRSSESMKYDSISLTFGVLHGSAECEYYSDDGISFEYLSGEYLHVVYVLSMSKNEIRISVRDEAKVDLESWQYPHGDIQKSEGSFVFTPKVERITIYAPLSLAPSFTHEKMSVEKSSNNVKITVKLPDLSQSMTLQ